MLWNAWGAWAELTIPNTIVKHPKPMAETAMMTARTRTARSRPPPGACVGV